MQALVARTRAAGFYPAEATGDLRALQNMPEFHAAFGCKQGDAMVRPAAQQCRLW
jgi:predicted metalloendopeptidase